MIGAGARSTNSGACRTARACSRSAGASAPGEGNLTVARGPCLGSRRR